MRGRPYCAYPPSLAPTASVTEQQDGRGVRFIVGDDAVGRFVLLGPTEHAVLRMFDGCRCVHAVSDEFRRMHGKSMSPGTLAGFLRTLDDAGVLAGTHTMQRGDALTSWHYVRVPLFNPDPFLREVLPYLHWLWRRDVVIAGLVFMAGALALGLSVGAEIDAYASHVMREHWPGVAIATVAILITHEFAHGLTCHAFGGRVTEMGVLLIYYVFPGFYCNVSSVHRLPRRVHRVSVIAAGVYWQGLVGAVSLVVWFCAAPFTWLADFCFAVFLGSVLNLAFNANPLVKLDGYYALSQWLSLPNLMDRGREFWRLSAHRWLRGRNAIPFPAWSRREAFVYCVFGLLSGCFGMGLLMFVVHHIARVLVPSLHFAGLLITAAVALLLMHRFTGVVWTALGSVARRVWIPGAPPRKTQAERDGATPETDMSTLLRKLSLRRVLTVAAVSAMAVLLFLPWTASLGAYGVLSIDPQRLVIIRAPESATAADVLVRPGAAVRQGADIVRFRSLELEEQIAELEAQLAKAEAEAHALEQQMVAAYGAIGRSEAALEYQENEFAQVEAERRQILARLAAPPPESHDQPGSPVASLIRLNQAGDDGTPRYPAALAAIQAEAVAREFHLQDATQRVERARRLYAEGLLARADLATTEMQASSLAMDLETIRERLAAALVEHQRRHIKVRAELRTAQSDVRSGRARLETIDTALTTMRSFRERLSDRLRILRQKTAALDVRTPQDGVVLGDDLVRLKGQYVHKGTEICRIADTSQLLLRIPVSERELADVRVGNPVRVRTALRPGRSYRGVVSRISDEAVRTEAGQVAVHVELLIDNEQGKLRTGMTAFARVDFGQWTVARILVHKIRQALRQEIWML